MSLNRYNPSRDANEIAISHYLRSQGCEVWPISGAGVPDLLIGFCGQFYVAEVKMPRGKLTIAQESFKLVCERVDLPYPIFRSVEDAEGWVEQVLLSPTQI